MASKQYIINGKKVELFTIGALASELGRENQTIRLWEKQGKIPEATYRTETGQRLYSKGQIEAITQTVKKYNLKQGVKIPDEFVDDVFYRFKRATEELEN